MITVAKTVQMTTSHTRPSLLVSNKKNQTWTGPNQRIPGRILVDLILHLQIDYSRKYRPCNITYEYEYFAFCEDIFSMQFKKKKDQQLRIYKKIEANVFGLLQVRNKIENLN